jgi:hypothetical protein
MTTVEFPEQIAEVQAQVARADTKASILTGLSLAALSGGTAVATHIRMHGVAVAAAVLTAALIGAALVLLGWAIRPDLNGDHGFVRWAAAKDETELYEELTASPYLLDRRFERLTYIALLSRSAHRKYRRIRRAVDLLGVALAAAGITALLTGLGW